MKISKTKVGRLAMRQEGTMWNAYYALSDTMKGAIPIGSIAMNAVRGNPERKDAFMGMMAEFVAEMLKEATGADVVDMTDVHPAPEHERGGNA
jgi:F0F1-type ATP synthase membrane subunit a